MRQDKRTIPNIYRSPAAILVAVMVIIGCAGSGGTKQPSQTANQATGANGQVQACKAAIEDVTLYCAGDKASTGKCSDAKNRTRESCIN